MNDSSEDRMAPIPRERMTEAQRAAADELIAGPRKAVKGPFIALLRSPELMARLQRVGEYLRFQSALPARLSEFATLLVARHWTQQFEWAVHVPLAIAAGTSPATIATLRAGHRPETMSDAEAVVYDLLAELGGRQSIPDALR
jgi:4-carboxymuconolactone decarboxylase